MHFKSSRSSEHKIISDLKDLYCDMYILMNYLFNPYMSKEPIISLDKCRVAFWIDKNGLNVSNQLYHWKLNQ